MRYALTPFQPFAAAIVATLLAGGLAACADTQRKEAEEAAKNTFACQVDGQRLIMKFEAGEARLLLPDGDRVILYQVPMGSGIRYTNGSLDLRGKGMDLQLIRNGNPSPLVGCEPYVPPK